MNEAELISLKERVAISADYTPAERDFLLDAINAYYVLPTGWTSRMTIHMAPNEAPIASLWAVLNWTPAGEDICATILPELGSTPLVTGKERIAKLFAPWARTLAHESKRAIRLVRFDRAAIVETYRA